MFLSVLVCSCFCIDLVPKVWYNAIVQDYITQNYYTCTNDILSGLGKVYVADERFKKNIDKYGEGTAEFAADAIAAYTKKR